jgi:hypothetical protein
VTPPDIVERLRRAGVRDGFVIILKQHTNEAADEIERLRLLRTEIERLRAALQKIIKRYETAEDGWPAEDMVAMAKNALDNHNPRWPDPTPEMLASPEFEAVWQCIKGWDIGVPDAYVGYCGPTGNHVRAILDALERKP